MNQQQLHETMRESEPYALGWEEGYLTGVESGYEKGECETWDEAFAAGYKAAKEELGMMCHDR